MCSHDLAYEAATVQKLEAQKETIVQKMKSDKDKAEAIAQKLEVELAKEKLRAEEERERSHLGLPGDLHDRATTRPHFGSIL